MQNFGGANKVRYGKICKWGIKYTADPFPQNRVFKRRQRVLKRGEGWGGGVGVEGFEAFEVSADLDLGRIHGHLFPCH